jgi:REP element-mobilizing transposase RayT
MAKPREKSNCLVFGYYFMDNHVHLIINDNGNDISKLMKVLICVLGNIIVGMNYCKIKSGATN